MRELTIDIAGENGHQFGFNVITEITNSMELMDKIKKAVSIPVEKRVSPKSTDIEKQESIVIILSDMITEIADRREILDEHLVNRMTHQEQRIIGETLKKLLALDNLKVVTII